MEAQDDARQGQEEEAAVAGYLVFFVRDPVDDALAAAIVDRVRAFPGAGWFDDPGAATAAERTTGGYVRVTGPDEPSARSLREVARTVSSDLGLVVELQWREQVVAHCHGGSWRPLADTP